MISNITDYRKRVEEFESRKIRSWLWRYCRRKSALEDLQQDVYEQLLKADLKKIQGIRAFEPYVHGVCKNIAVDWLRRLKQYAQVECDVESLEGFANTPERCALILEALTRLRTVIIGLPKRQRQTYLMRNVFGYSVAEIAAKRRRTRATVRRTLCNAVSSIRAGMGGETSISDQQSIAGLLGLEE